MLALILIRLSVKIWKKKKCQIMMWKSLLFYNDLCPEKKSASNDLCAEKKSAFEREEVRMAFQNADLHSPGLYVCGLVLWVPQVISQPAAHEGWWLLALSALRHCRSLWRRMVRCSCLLSDTDGVVGRAGEGSLFCHFPCCSLSVVKKRLQTPELSIWHFSLALKNNFKTY